MNTKLCWIAVGIWFVVVVINMSIQLSKCKGQMFSISPTGKCKALHESWVWNIWTLVACIVVCGLSCVAMLGDDKNSM